MKQSPMITDLRGCYTAILIKLQFVQCFSILLSLDMPQAASCSSTFHAFACHDDKSFLVRWQAKSIDL
jgi:hypothetical protein